MLIRERGGGGNAKLVKLPTGFKFNCLFAHIRFTVEKYEPKGSKVGGGEKHGSKWLDH